MSWASNKFIFSWQVLKQEEGAVKWAGWREVQLLSRGKALSLLLLFTAPRHVFSQVQLIIAIFCGLGRPYLTCTLSLRLTFWNNCLSFIDAVDHCKLSLSYIRPEIFFVFVLIHVCLWRSWYPYWILKRYWMETMVQCPIS